MKIKLHCQDPWFSYIKEGVKTIEGRKYSKKYQDLKKGDTIIFYNGEDEFETKIIDIKIYKNLDEYLRKNDLKNILPNVSSLEKGKKIYLSFNDEDELKKYKFVGIEVKRTK